MSIKPVVAPSSVDVFKPDIFQGKVLFCTGGGSGICKAMTEAVMRHGANATIVGRKLDRLTAAANELSQVTGQTCVAARADVRQPQQLKEAVALTIERFGRIDFVICGAAGNFLASIDGMSENAFKTVVEIDTLGTFNTVKSTLPYVRASRGAYIHVSSTLHYKGTPYQAHVSAAKAAVDAFSAVLALEEGPKGVQSANTEGMSRLSSQISRLTASLLPYPLGRAGEVQDCRSHAASYITGQVLAVDGGYEHVRASQVPYPEAVLDPESIVPMTKSRL
ncbi:hypothetical protein F5141DRAFT_1194021 [Pisolithus sp. B1]|nr:hypothetical protein F5141DRAFT_1194021 [Pisolithus sp. B1]